MFLFVN